MKLKFKLQESNSPEIELDKSFWLGKIKVCVNGKEVKPMKEKGNPFPIPMGDGTVKKMLVKGGLDDLPKVIVDGKRIHLGRKLFWYEYALGLIPVVLLMGGAWGGFCGGVGVLVNFKILRTSYTMRTKVLFVVGVTFFSSFIYAIIVVMFHLLMSAGGAI
ncbi:hypothetical protein KAI68_02715 [bacterium]|nr:hypothetical protein [bacterium]